MSEMKSPSATTDSLHQLLSRPRKVCRRQGLRGFPLVVSMMYIVLAAAQTQGIASTPSNHLESEFKTALASYKEHRFTQAAVELEALAREVPKSFEVQELLGLTYGAQSQDAKAVEHLQIAVDLDPASAPARANLAAGLLRQGKLQEAEIQCRKGLDLDPQNYDANRNFAELLLRENRLTDALPLLEAAQRIRPDAYDNGYDLALAYLLTGKLPEARQRADMLVRQKDSGELHALLGRIDEGESKYLDAANEFALAAHQDPSEDNLFIWASELLLHRTYEPAIEVFRQATRLYPTSPRLWIGLGMALYSRGEYQEAIASLLNAADLDPKDPRCYLFLSKAYLSSPNQAEKVIAHFQRYAELEPDNALAQFYYAMSFWKGLRVNNPDVDYKAVEALLKKSISLNDREADAHLQLGILYNDEHAFEKSLPEYERALQLNPELADAHFRLGRYYLRVGEKAKAQSEFDAFKTLQAKHQSEVDKERAEVQQFVVSAQVAPSTTP